MAHQMLQKGVSGAGMVAILQTWKLWPVARRDTSSSKLKTSVSNPPSLLCVNRQTLGGGWGSSHWRLLMSGSQRAHVFFSSLHSRCTAGGGFKLLIVWSYSWREQGSSFLFYTAIPTEYVDGSFCTQGLHGPRAEPIEKPGTPPIETLY